MSFWFYMITLLFLVEQAGYRLLMWLMGLQQARRIAWTAAVRRAGRPRVWLRVTRPVP